ncbi:2OG-Fe(II) oxygenase [Methylobrevis pamukkalensis]|uniref:Fe(II)-dependent oxygenase superfamily protein n=1 Tax=Methylobrevis pamukkalensis TaxID=1439726 RepID=A0A1E3GZL5_9HYPH|nr:2OG-Fe(II) oxygenase [Methylobrevis pamukkalensis]ODN69482.1 Fe(II)-dependent oxygenase superfamily protein [Methylobrevis pamukkalensis]
MVQAARKAPTYNALGRGDPAPWFRQRTAANPNFVFDTVAGRYIVLCFFGSAGDAAGKAAIEEAHANRHLFDDVRASFFGVSNDPTDEASGRVQPSNPGIRHFWDFDGSVGRLYGAVPQDAAPGDTRIPIRRFWVVIDPTLRILATIPFAPDGSDRKAVMDMVARLPPPASFAGMVLQAPVIYLPNVFEPEFCQRLIGLYEAHGGEESGFMREIDGKTVAVHDHGHKRRRDYTIEDQDLIRQTQARILRRVVPEILKVHQFRITRMERYIVSCYAAEDGAHFRAHRDNTTKGTAHRRFAVSINLNDDFGGGEVSFPEYGPRSFKAPPGGAVVFSCSLLHAVSPVTRGRRYAFLPFLYDDEAAKIREQNNAFLAEGVEAYRTAEA